MSTMRQFFGGSFLQVAFDRFSSPDLLNFIRRWKIDLVEVESLKRTTAKIQALFDEAEVKQFTSDAVKLWLDHLKQILYDAEDILDEYASELLRLKLEFEYHEIHPHQTQQEINRFGSNGSDIDESLKMLKLEPEFQTHAHQSPQVCNSAPLTLSESSVSSFLKSGTETAVKGFGSKVRDINERLKSEAQEGFALGLNSSMGSGSSTARAFSQRPQTSSLLNRSEVFGREEDKEKIVKWLLSEKTPSPSDKDYNFSVLPIVGMGGAGKTTLAQLVYNDETVQSSKYFDLKAWVCVSEDFDLVRLTKEILESATGSSPSSNSLDTQQRELKKVLSRKRFLLVLDDMWNEDYQRWHALRTPFAFGKPGSKILVTTRNKRVSSIVHTDLNDHDHDLKGLSDKDCFALFRRHAFIDGNSSDAKPKLEVFRQEIVEKCKGLPLVVKTLAGLLRGKKETSEWKDILENEIWDLRDCEILPSLMLSYHHLPPLLKRCFAYCALFPKDYVFNKIELVLLWMAEGIVQPKPKGKKRLEDVGVGYFDELFMRSFFELSSNRNPLQLYPFVEPSRDIDRWFHDLSTKLNIKSFFESSSNVGLGFVMHDLIHDLAQFVSGEIHCRREYDKPSKVLTTTRHLSYLTDNCNVESTEYEAMKKLHTLLDLKDHLGFFNKELFPTMQFQFLRVLRVRNCRNHELPDSIGKLKHLRLLDLSFSDIESLPDSITSLYNLQTLVLTECWSLRKLPKDMGNFVNLRHLSLSLWSSDIHSSEMPLGVGTLTSLQTLSTFVVGSKNSNELRDLSQQLRGSLNISKLENIDSINGTETMVVNLKNNPHLLALRLHWSDHRFRDLGRDERVEEDVIDQLQPHTDLEALCIQNYGGTRFPSWIEDPLFSNLETVILLDCLECWFLPHLRNLPCLKHLVIQGSSATKIEGDESSSLANKKFRSLETLHIERMEEWEVWTQVVEEEGGGQFPCLRELTIRYCPKLRMFSHCFPSLEKLEVEICYNLRELPRLLPLLHQLSVWQCPEVVVLPSLPFIERLNLFTCDQITTLSDSGHPSSSSSTTSVAPRMYNSFSCLRELRISYGSNLRELPSILPSLESLQIYDCKKLCFLPMLPSIKELKLTKCKGMVLMNNKMVLDLSSLSSLTINEVSDLESLPNKFIQQLTSLKKLEIYHCIDLVVLLQNEIGSDLLPSSLQRLYICECDNLRKLLQNMCNLHCLNELIIEGARGLTSLPEGLHNLTSLRVLQISNCENLESLPKELHTLTSLQEFIIKSFPTLVSFSETGLPTMLRRLEIIDCKNLESLPMQLLHNLTSLQRLEIKECPTLEFFPGMRLPPALRDLSIQKCGKLNFLPKELHKLTNLQQLKIVECSSLMDCKNQEPLLYWGLRNLTTLRSLTIGECPTLVSIRKGLLPMNIWKLCIEDCPILESLNDGLSDLTSLELLEIRNCPMLGCQKKEGEEWSMISQIRFVTIDGQDVESITG